MASVSKNHLAEGRALAHHPFGNTLAPGWAAPCFSPFPGTGGWKAGPRAVPEQVGSVSRSKYPEKSPRGCRCKRLGTLSTVPSGVPSSCPPHSPAAGDLPSSSPKNQAQQALGGYPRI